MPADFPVRPRALPDYFEKQAFFAEAGEQIEGNRRYMRRDAVFRRTPRIPGGLNLKAANIFVITPPRRSG